MLSDLRLRITVHLLLLALQVGKLKKLNLEYFLMVITMVKVYT
jgi:hypothetical protein